MANPVIDRLRIGLRRPLSGRVAQRRFEPELACGRHFADPPAGAREAAVVTLLYPAAKGLLIPLIVRPDQMEHHANQVSLPGGMVEPGEESSAAALRELEEEIGVPAARIELLGRLSPLYVFVSNHYVIPWVAVLDVRPTLRPDAREVAEVLELPLDHLCDPAYHDAGWHETRGIRIRTPYIACGRHRIWGATAMILAELATLAADQPALVGSQNPPPF